MRRDPRSQAASSGGSGFKGRGFRGEQAALPLAAAENAAALGGARPEAGSRARPGSLLPSVRSGPRSRCQIFPRTARSPESAPREPLGSAGPRGRGNGKTLLVSNTENAHILEYSRRDFLFFSFLFF